MHNRYSETSAWVRKALLLLGFFLLLTARSFAQERTITGTVSASDTKETLPGATVVIKGTTTGTATDINGKYSLKVSGEKPILVYSFMGYTTKEITLGAENIIDVVMEPTK